MSPMAFFESQPVFMSPITFYESQLFSCIIYQHFFHLFYFRRLGSSKQKLGQTKIGADENARTTSNVRYNWQHIHVRPTPAINVMRLLYLWNWESIYKSETKFEKEWFFTEH